jgi:hypothetical protein
MFHQHTQTFSFSIATLQMTRGEKKVHIYRVSNHNINASQLLDRLFNHPLALRRQSHVRLNRHSLNTMFLALCLHLLSRLDPVEVVDGDVGAFFCEGC